ncbi:MAG: histidine kinase dimerization/phospho-acceptor domain-containing protein [Sphingopyxis sp.]
MQLSHNATPLFSYLSQTNYSRYLLAKAIEDVPVRFDDRLETILRIDPAYESGRITIWRQLIDMLSQSGAQMSEAATSRCFKALSYLRDEVPLAVRIASISSIANRTSFPPLIAFLAHDNPRVAIAAIDNAVLADSGWLAILPIIGPVGRSRLRQKRDLPMAVHRALQSFGASDFSLPTPDIAMTPTQSESHEGKGSSEIADLVRRIDSYRQNTLAPRPVPRIGVRCDSEGRIRAVQGANRTRFVGISLLEPARATEPGCDAGVARAFGKRAPIRNGRLFICEVGEDGGYWALNMDPEFDGQSGRFTGYSGDIRRFEQGEAINEADEVPTIDNTVALADSMRQLVHELRSPLNAISGFAQLIHGQYFGPVGLSYRELANQIILDSTRLTVALEEIDLAARLDAGQMTADESEGNVHTALAALDLPFEVIEAPEIAVIASVSERDITQIAERLCAAIRQLESGDCVANAKLSRDTKSGMAAIVITTEQDYSAALLGDAEQKGATLYGQGEANLLGPAFTLRLVDQMAQIHGGNLKIAANQFILNLPLLHGVTNRFGASR